MQPTITYLVLWLSLDHNNNDTLPILINNELSIFMSKYNTKYNIQVASYTYSYHIGKHMILWMSPEKNIHLSFRWHYKTIASTHNLVFLSTSEPKHAMNILYQLY